MAAPLKGKRGPRVAAMVLAAVCSGACAPSGQAPDEEPIPYHIGMARGYYRLGDYPRAVEMHQKALDLDPGNAEVCLQLGIIYDDNLKDKERAAVYYREFLRLAPDSEKARRVSEWLARSEEAAVREQEIGVLLPVPTPAAGTVSTPAAAPAAVPAAAPSPTAVPRAPAGTYTVAKGDTLAGIADKFYGKRSQWNLIYEANRDRLEAPEKLKIGQVLIIPPAE